jgi:ribonuclease P protein component
MCDSSLPGPMVGFALGRSFGPAVARNRLRRQLRALLAERSEVLPAGVFVFGASPRARDISPSDLASQVDRLVALVAERASRGRTS